MLLVLLLRQVLNRAVFPINYPERMYKDILAYTDVTHLAFHNDVLVGAIACRLEKAPQVGCVGGTWMSEQ